MLLRFFECRRRDAVIPLQAGCFLPVASFTPLQYAPRLQAQRETPPRGAGTTNEIEQTSTLPRMRSLLTAPEKPEPPLAGSSNNLFPFNQKRNNHFCYIR